MLQQAFHNQHDAYHQIIVTAFYYVGFFKLHLVMIFDEGTTTTTTTTNDDEDADDDDCLCFFNLYKLHYL